MAQLDYPIRPNAKGGFDILLKQSLTSPAVSATAAVPAADEPPDMAGAQASMVGPENAGGQDWMSAVGEAARTRGVNVPAGLNGARAQYTPPPDMGGGPLGKMLPAGMGDTLAGVAGGMNTIDRNQSPLAGFAAGFSGAMTTREGRRKDKREEMLAEDERLYRRSRDAKGDLIEGRKLTLAEQAAEREGRSSQRDEALDAMSAQIKGLEIKKASIELERLATQQGFTVDQYQKAVDQGNRITEVEWEGTTVDDSNRKAFQDSVKRNIQTALQQGGGGGAQGNAGAGGAASGTGASVDDPLQWAPGAEPRSDAELTAAMDAAVAANGGQPITVIDPATKKPRLYRGTAVAR